jgi:hypothetical protein
LTNEEYLQLASLWTTPPAVAEREALARLARRTPRIARWVQYGELGVVLLLAAAIGAAVIWRLGADTLLLGSLILLLLAWSAWKRHRLADRALLIDRSDRFSYLSSLVQAKEAELARSAVGLALILPGTLLATVLAHVVYVDAPPQEVAAFLPAIWLSARGMVSFLFLFCALLLLALSHLRLVAELGRLRRLREDYLEEQRRDGDVLF